MASVDDGASRTKGTIDFRHEATNDMVIATASWLLERPTDGLARWAAYERPCEHFGRTMDVILVLDDFDLTPAITITLASLWDEYRATLVVRIMRSSCRVRAGRRVQTFVLTSGARIDDDAPGRAGGLAPSAREAAPARLSKQRGDGPKYEHGAETPQKIRPSTQRRGRSLRASTW